MEYKVVKKEDIRGFIRSLFYPRESFILEDNNAFDGVFKYCLDWVLNTNIYEVRAIELFKSGKVVDLEFNEALVSSVYSGCKISKIVNIFPATVSTDFFNVWRVRFASNPNFLVNLTRYNQDFREFVFSYSLFNQLRSRYSNTNVDYNVVRKGRDVYKIILGNSFNNIDRVWVVFLPHFCLDGGLRVYDEDGDVVELKDVGEWLFTTKEFNFLCKYMYGYIMWREGVALSELSIVGELNTNKELFLEKSKELMEDALNEYKRYNANLLGRRI